MSIQKCVHEGPRVHGVRGPWVQGLHRIQWENTYELFSQKLLGQFKANLATMVLEQSPFKIISDSLILQVEGPQGGQKGEIN